MARIASHSLFLFAVTGSGEAAQRHHGHRLSDSLSGGCRQGRLSESPDRLPAVVEAARPSSHPSGGVSSGVFPPAEATDLGDASLRDSDSPHSPRAGRHAKPQPRAVCARDHQGAERPRGGPPDLLQAERGLPRPLSPLVGVAHQRHG